MNNNTTTLRFTFEMSTDGIWDDGEMPVEYPDQVAGRMAKVLAENYPDVNFEWVVDIEVMSPYERLNPAIGRDNNEVRELHPEIDQAVSDSYNTALQRWDELA